MAYPPSTVAADKTSATRIDTGDDHANHHNAVAAAVNDVVTELGTGPKGGSADLTARLSALDSTVAGKAATGHNHSGVYQPLATVLTNTTASFLTAQETKLGHISVTQAVDLDAIESRVNGLDAAVILKGTWDASAGTFPGGGTAQAGESWIVSVGGTVDSVVFVANDRIIAITDNASTTVYAANWHKADYTDLVTSVDGQTGAVSVVSDTAYAGSWNGVTTIAPSKNAVYDEIELRQAKATFPVCIGVALSDESTAITTGTAKVTIRAPFAFTLTGVRANLNTASSSGLPTVDINEAGVSVLSTKLTIDANELTSVTAATPAVISDSAIADDALITFDVDTAGTGAKGLKVWLIGTRAV